MSNLDRANHKRTEPIHKTQNGFDSNKSDWLLSNNKYSQKKNLGNAKTISISSGKGGVGKTSLALKLATILSNDDYRVLLIDCDFNLSNTAVKLGLPVTSSFYEFLIGEKTFAESLIHLGKLDILPGCNGHFELLKEHFDLERIIIDVLVNYENEYDYIILDSPAGLTKETLTLNAYSDYRFVVVTPDKSSVTDSYSLIKILSKEYGVNHHHLILNQISNQNQFQRLVTTFLETAEKYIGCRIQVRGNIKKIQGDIAVDQFDSQYLLKENNSFHENIQEIVHHFLREDENLMPSISLRRSSGLNAKL